jgi:hypothetical protein
MKLTELLAQLLMLSNTKENLDKEVHVFFKGELANIGRVGLDEVDGSYIELGCGLVEIDEDNTELDGYITWLEGKR